VIIDSYALPVVLLGDPGIEGDRFVRPGHRTTVNVFPIASLLLTMLAIALAAARRRRGGNQETVLRLPWLGTAVFTSNRCGDLRGADGVRICTSPGG
jgi:hypothetical protein